MPCSIFKWVYMYAKCLYANSHSKYSCGIPRGLNGADSFFVSMETGKDGNVMEGS